MAQLVPDKVNYCGYSRIARDRSVPELRKPYDLMREVLDGIDRDIVFSIGEYGWGDVWEWGESAGGNLWRTTGDLENSWTNLESVGFRQDGRQIYAGPGHWNDTDMLIVGKLSWGRGELVETALTRNEQLVHLTLWAIQAAPLMIGADMSQLDPWTIDLLTNDEVLAVTNDPLGTAGGSVWKDGGRLEVWARSLNDNHLGGRPVQPRPRALRGHGPVGRYRTVRKPARARSLGARRRGRAQRCLHGRGAAPRREAHQGRARRRAVGPCPPRPRPLSRIFRMAVSLLLCQSR